MNSQQNSRFYSLIHLYYICSYPSLVLIILFICIMLVARWIVRSHDIVDMGLKAPQPLYIIDNIVSLGYKKIHFFKSKHQMLTAISTNHSVSVNLILFILILILILIHHISLLFLPFNNPFCVKKQHCM